MTATPITPEELKDWPRGGYENRAYLCTEDKPMPPKASGHWQHSRTTEVGEQEGGWPSGDNVTIECQNCGHRWKTELPQ